MNKKIKLIDYLVVLHPELKREQLIAFVWAGNIEVNGAKCRDSQTPVLCDAVVQMVEKPHFSRGSQKLEYVFRTWKLDAKDKVFLDAGASTGGFTRVLLDRGASLVHCVDVGRNQLDYSLRINPKVKVYEKTNIMNVQRLEPQADVAVVDLSFRSLVGAASYVLSLTREKWIVALIKPQFERKEKDPAFDGVIHDSKILRSVLHRVVDELAEEASFVQDILESPIRGAKGNREFFARIASQKNDQSFLKKRIDKTVIENVRKNER